VTNAGSKSGDTPFNKTSFLLFITHKIKHSRDLLCGTFLTQKCCYVSFERLDIYIFHPARFLRRVTSSTVPQFRPLAMLIKNLSAIKYCTKPTAMPKQC